jgi:hypothetical protein
MVRSTYSVYFIQAINTISRWSYRERHNVQLPDEYDRIYHDLEPFWGMDPVDLNRLQAEHESYRDSFTIGKTEDSNITVVTSVITNDDPSLNTVFHADYAKSIADKLNQVSKFIPSFRAVYSIHDNPNMTTYWELKAQALQAASTQNCTY